LCLSCGCGEAGPSGCDNTCGSTLENDECGVCDGPGADAGHDCDGNCVDAAICGAASISFSNVTSESADVLYSSNVDVYGFQFNIQGVTLTGASSGFDMTSFGATGTVIGFSMSGTSLSSGDGTLASLTFEPSSDGGTISLGDLIVSGADGASLDADAPADASVPGCAVTDCAGDCNGSATIDDCGVCGGGNADMDECGICGGDGSSCVYGVAQSMEQAFYSFGDVTLDGAGLEVGDWLIAKNGVECDDGDCGTDLHNQRINKKTHILHLQVQYRSLHHHN
jgi:hypothetical protein